MRYGTLRFYSNTLDVAELSTKFAFYMNNPRSGLKIEMGLKKEDKVNAVI